MQRSWLSCAKSDYSMSKNRTAHSRMLHSVADCVGTIPQTLLTQGQPPKRGPRRSPAKYPQGVCRIRSAAKLLTAALLGSVGKGGVPQGDFLRAKGSERSFSPQRRKRSSRTFRRRRGLGAVELRRCSGKLNVRCSGRLIIAPTMNPSAPCGASPLSGETKRCAQMGRAKPPL